MPFESSWITFRKSQNEREREKAGNWLPEIRDQKWESTVQGHKGTLSDGNVLDLNCGNGYTTP